MPFMIASRVACGVGAAASREHETSGPAQGSAAGTAAAEHEPPLRRFLSGIKHSGATCVCDRCPGGVMFTASAQDRTGLAQDRHADPRVATTITTLAVMMAAALFLV